MHITVEMDSLGIKSLGNPLLCRKYTSSLILLRIGSLNPGNYGMDRTPFTSLDDTAILESFHRYIFNQTEMDISYADANDSEYACGCAFASPIVLFCIHTQCIRVYGFLLCYP